MSEITKEDRLLLALAHDRADDAADRYMISTTEFLDLRQRSLIENEFKYDRSLSFYGGFDEAERTIAVFRPEYIEEDMASWFSKNMEDDPICWLRIDVARGSKKLSHRDYLGSLTGMGIKREKIGDILVREDGADIAIMRDISDFLLFNYEKAGRVNLNVKLAEKSDFDLPEPHIKVITDTVASLRLDSVLSSAFGLSRAKASEAVKRGIVFVNSALVEKSDFGIKEGDRLVIRGMGKARLAEIGGKSRKDRIYIKIERYI